MKPKTYRRLTNFLFAFLFLIFVLLFLLLGDAGMLPQRGGGQHWSKLTREMGTIRLSEVRSGGFALEELPIPDPTALNSETFNDNVLRVDATLYNEGAGPIGVTLSLFGSQVLEEGNQGLCGLYQDYAPRADPFSERDYAAWAASAGLAESAESKNMRLYLPRDVRNTLTLEAGETRMLTLLFWVDENEVDSLTDLDREGYSATVKLISRSL